MDIALILTREYAGSEWTLNGDSYSGLTWLSDGDAPTLEELEGHWQQVQFDTAYEAVERARQAEYQATTDPLFFSYQRGEATEQEWLDAVQVVKDAHPYPLLEDFAPEPEPEVVEPEVVEPEVVEPEVVEDEVV